MSAAVKRKLTPAEYLVLERAAPFRSEYFGGEMFAMAGASWERTLIKDNLADEMRHQLRGGPCRVLTSDMRVKVSKTGLYTYPDVVVVCDQPQLEDKHLDTLLNPKLIVEVLSESTEKYDRGKSSSTTGRSRHWKNTSWSRRTTISLTASLANPMIPGTS